MNPTTLLVALAAAGVGALTVWRYFPRRPDPIHEISVSYVPRPSDLRTTASELQPGDEVFVWAHDTPHLSAPCACDMWRHGVVAAVGLDRTGKVLRPITLTFDGGAVVFAVPKGVAYVVNGGPVEDPDPADEPEPAPEPEPRYRSIKVGSIKPGMDVTVEVTAETRGDGAAGWGVARAASGHTQRGRVLGTSRTGDLVYLRLAPAIEDGEERRVYANAHHAAQLHTDVDAPYDQEQEASTP